MAAADGHHILPVSSTTPPEATSAFHCWSVSLNLFTGRQAWPDPSKIPSPVRAIFSQIPGGEGGGAADALAALVDGPDRRIILESGAEKHDGPFLQMQVDSALELDRPGQPEAGGNAHRPAPAAAQASIARAKALVFMALPPAIAP